MAFKRDILNEHERRNKLALQEVINSVTEKLSRSGKGAVLMAREVEGIYSQCRVNSPLLSDLADLLKETAFYPSEFTVDLKGNHIVISMRLEDN